jgi:glycosyltransferase involved in cell wall biosynthesis
MLTQWFSPEPDFKGLPFARELVRRGHEVQVLTGFPNYPGGKVYEGYRIRPLQREVLDGISVIRVPLYPSHDSSSIRRILNYISFAVSAALLAPLLVRQADVAYVYHAPATIALPAMVLKIVRRIPFVYDINDLWPDSLAATTMMNSRMVLKLVGLWCRLTYRMADRIVVVTPGFKIKLQERGVPGSKVDVIYNWCDEIQTVKAEQSEAERTGEQFAGRFDIVFAGTMGKAQALDAVLDAAALVAERYPAIRFVFVGGGIETDRLKARARTERLDNVTFLPRRPVSEIGSILHKADVLLVHLKADPLFRITIPSKTQAYLASGRPILMGVMGDAADLVERAEAGIACTPEDPESIARNAVALYTMPLEQREALGENGRRFYERELSLVAGVNRFEDIFRAVARQHRENSAA